MTFSNIIRSTISLMTVFLFGSTGEILIEKSGHLNMGIPGIMAFGGMGGVIGEIIYLSSVNINSINPFLVVFIGVLFSLIFASFGGLIFSFFTVTLKSNQNVIGLLLTTFLVALSSFLNSKISSLPAYDLLPKAGKYFNSMFFPGIPISQLNIGQSIFLSYGFLTYLSIIIAILLAVFLNKTRVGLSLRSVGENPASADSNGINVNRYRYIATIVGSAIAGLGGLYLLMDRYQGSDPSINVETYGWLAVSLVIFSMWKPTFAILGSFLFSLFYTLSLNITASGVLQEFLKMIPYLMTLSILIITSIFKFKNSQPPEGLGQSYFREDR